MKKIAVVLLAAGVAAGAWFLRSLIPQWLRTANRVVKPVAGLPNTAENLVPTNGASPASSLSRP